MRRSNLTAKVGSTHWTHLSPSPDEVVHQPSHDNPLSEAPANRPISHSFGMLVDCAEDHSSKDAPNVLVWQLDSLASFDSSHPVPDELVSIYGYDILRILEGLPPIVIDEFRDPAVGPWLYYCNTCKRFLGIGAQCHYDICDCARHFCWFDADVSQAVVLGEDERKPLRERDSDLRSRNITLPMVGGDVRGRGRRLPDCDMEHFHRMGYHAPTMEKWHIPSLAVWEREKLRHRRSGSLVGFGAQVDWEEQNSPVPSVLREVYGHDFSLIMSEIAPRRFFVDGDETAQKFVYYCRRCRRFIGIVFQREQSSRDRRLGGRRCIKYTHPDGLWSKIVRTDHRRKRE